MISRNRSARRVSRLMFSRSTPASRRGFASSGSRLPLVVRQSSSSSGMARSVRQMSRIPRRTSGSPPVKRIFRTPSFTAARAISAALLHGEDGPVRAFFHALLRHTVSASVVAEVRHRQPQIINCPAILINHRITSYRPKLRPGISPGVFAGGTRPAAASGRQVF